MLVQQQTPTNIRSKNRNSIHGLMAYAKIADDLLTPLGDNGTNNILWESTELSPKLTPKKLWCYQTECWIATESFLSSLLGTQNHTYVYTGRMTERERATGMRRQQQQRAAAPSLPYELYSTHSMGIMGIYMLCAVHWTAYIYDANPHVRSVRLSRIRIAESVLCSLCMWRRWLYRMMVFRGR